MGVELIGLIHGMRTSTYRVSGSVTKSEIQGFIRSGRSRVAGTAHYLRRDSRGTDHSCVFKSCIPERIRLSPFPYSVVHERNLA